MIDFKRRQSLSKQMHTLHLHHTTCKTYIQRVQYEIHSSAESAIFPNILVVQPYLTYETLTTVCSSPSWTSLCDR